ncbi:MAG TPA: histidine phosphatase family protein [Burkholderiales bacterium]
MAETRIALIRHGETEWNREGRIQGYNADSALTETGRAQAQALAARLGREGIDALYSSDAGRTRETAGPISAATGLPVIHEAALRERNYGVFEGFSFSGIEVEFPVEYEKFRTRDPHYAPPGGESAEQFRARIIGALEAIAVRARGKRVAVVTHGGVVGMLYRQAIDIPLQEKRSYSLANASLNLFRFKAGRWLLDTWGDVAHLPAESLDGL